MNRRMRRVTEVLKRDQVPVEYAIYWKRKAGLYEDGRSGPK